MQHRTHSCCRVQPSRPHREQLHAQAVERKTGRRWPQTLRSAFSYLAFAGAFLLPKCPLCLAAWAAALGMGAAGQHLLLSWLDPRYRPALMLMLTVPLLLQIAFALRPLTQRINSGSSHRRG